jgi:hypothetical protein
MPDFLVPLSVGQRAYLRGISEVTAITDREFVGTIGLRFEIVPAKDLAAMSRETILRTTKLFPDGRRVWATGSILTGPIKTIGPQPEPVGPQSQTYRVVIPGGLTDEQKTNHDVTYRPERAFEVVGHKTVFDPVTKKTVDAWVLKPCEE